MLPDLPPRWASLLESEVRAPSFAALGAFLADEERRGAVVLPPAAERFAALALTPPEEVRAVLLGQDPYPTPGDAHGLCFSVRRGLAPPRSLRNVYRELAADLPGFRAPGHGNLEAWARGGVLLLNTVLTVRAGEAGSHRGRGWEAFTDGVLRALARRPRRIVFALWGRVAQEKRPIVDAAPHAVVACAHPSPLSARHFLGCRCFSEINRRLDEAGLPPVDWTLPP
jgi:uracil-DNA glycosylase